MVRDVTLQVRCTLQRKRRVHNFIFIFMDGNFELDAKDIEALKDLISQKIEVDTLGFDMLKDIVESIVKREISKRIPVPHEHEVTLWFDTRKDMVRFCKEIENGTAKFIKE